MPGHSIRTRASGGRHGVNPPAARGSRRRLLIVTVAVTAIAVAGTAGLLFARNDVHPSAAPASASILAPPPPPPAVALAPPPPEEELPAELLSSFADLEETMGGVVGLAVTPLGGGPIWTFGHWSTGPAWSTSKVPLVMAAMRDEAEPMISPSMTAAIVRSDNDAAEAIWESLGDPLAAADKVDAVLREAGDQTVVESQRIRPQYTAFGQTVWSLADQARFLSHAACDVRMDPVLTLMGQIEDGQRWGLGTITDARFKGGWGPSPTGGYLVRQFGLVSSSQGTVAVSVAAEPASGSFGAGTQDLDAVASWLTSNLPEVPAGQCP